ncbi:uncharacterized protein C8A04DRAFT_25946 [Dichotomopilus funicola]|uniref:N-acetyltransferase domain-containing protein n=1 Tax=Dichotomopilus funicola TaxID=1934379 RepID=A0AAN6ZR58_9PEZI|nr:hypothetical protein C8A04DRAFT_25946 [Dichotomopilus funicola]
MADVVKVGGNDELKARVTTSKSRSKSRSEDDGWVPEALDVPAWLEVSAALRNERERVVGRLEDVCRITLLSIRPDYQRLGLGSALMHHICEDIDRHGRYGNVLSSPAGVRLYSKFRFEVVGRVETPYGPISSMLRRKVQRDVSVPKKHY